MNLNKWNATLFLLPCQLYILSTSALAQIIPDNTLPNNSIVTSQGNTLQITGGTETGNNLFHSFTEFSIPTGTEAFFNNGPETSNIFSRVTGNSISNIDGLIRANGSANLFLLNPHGIIFGPNAKLNIGGSFFATTAESLNFANGTFSATNTQAPPLLTINVPLGLQFGASPGAIRVEGGGHNLRAGAIGTIIRDTPSSMLQVPTGETLALVGGEITLAGGNLIAPEGRIELGSVAGNRQVSLMPSDRALTLEYSGTENFQNISLSGAASADASGAGGGDIQVQSQRLTLTEGSVILAITEGANPGGSLRVNASESVELSGISVERELTSALLTETQGKGNGGDLSVSTGTLIVRDGSQLSASTSLESTGNGGTLSVNASESVELIGVLANSPGISGLFASSAGAGVGGDVRIATGRLIIRDGAFVAAESFFGARGSGNLIVNASESVELIGLGLVPTGVLIPSSLSAGTESPGVGGDLRIATPQLIVGEGGFVSATASSTGNAGNLVIETRQLIVRDGGMISAVAISTGNAGNLTIETGQLIVQEGGVISAATSGVGQGGTLTVKATESIELIGTNAGGGPSGLFTQSRGLPPDFNNVDAVAGDAGDLMISTRRLIVREGAAVSADTFAEGQGGSLIVNASESIEVIGRSRVKPPPNTLSVLDADGLSPSRLTARTTGSGDAESASIITERLTVADGAIIAVDGSRGMGAAGNLEIQASDIRLQAGVLDAETNAGRGNITVRSDDLRLRRGSRITTNALGMAAGGNITIDTDTLAALENSDISANAEESFGGRVTIDAEGIFGTEFRDVPSLETSDITATSELGPQFSGIVEINRPEVDPTQGLVELDDRIVDVSNLIARNLCRENQGNEFTITGRGGVASSPNELLSAGLYWEDKSAPSESSITESHARLVEAQGWIVRADGKVELVANPPKVTPHAPWFGAPGCK